MDEDKQITFWWNLKKLHPRVDMQIPEGVSSSIFRKNFPFALRSTDRSDIHRHYKLPIRFHIPFVRWHYMQKLNNAIAEQNQNNPTD